MSKEATLGIIDVMMRMQDNLNKETAGDEWTKGVAANGKEINWWRCIYMEAAELVDSFPWKHWKDVDGSVDRDNMLVELVDIWHFLLSEAIREGRTPESVERALQWPHYDQYDTMGEIEKFISVAAEKAIHNSASGVLGAISMFSRICDVLDIEKDHIFTGYFAKNTLNKFRQDHGYKDGTYRKIWCGEEDNAWAFRLAKSVSHDKLYDALEGAYRSCDEEKEKD